MKKVAIGMAVLALCAGMAMAHNTITTCTKCGGTISSVSCGNSKCTKQDVPNPSGVCSKCYCKNTEDTKDLKTWCAPINASGN